MRFVFFTVFISFFSICYASETGSLLFNGNCLTCHNETKTISAPSVLEFKDRYMKAFKTKEEFVSYMSKWVKNPQEKTSLMHDAIKKHGLMPELGFDMQTLIDISGYIYETDFKKRNGYWRNN
ncbi:MAG: cytochrome C [Campylobacterota bacterium]